MVLQKGFLSLGKLRCTTIACEPSPSARIDLAKFEYPTNTNRGNEYIMYRSALIFHCALPHDCLFLLSLSGSSNSGHDSPWYRSHPRSFHRRTYSSSALFEGRTFAGVRSRYPVGPMCARHGKVRQWHRRKKLKFHLLHNPTEHVPIYMHAANQTPPPRFLKKTKP